MTENRPARGRKPDALKLKGPWEKAVRKALTKHDPPKKKKRPPK